MLLTAVLFLVSNASADHWNGDSDPAEFTKYTGMTYRKKFSDLPLAAELPENRRPWSGPFWPDRKGSINYNWQTNQKPWNALFPNEKTVMIQIPQQVEEMKQTVLKMSREEIATLPPSLKIDIVRGLYDFPTYRIATYLSQPSKPTKFLQKINPFWHAWFGSCTGLAQAALHYENPVPASFTNVDGVTVDFGSGDLKALTSFYYSSIAQVEIPYAEEPEKRSDLLTRGIGTNCGDAEEYKPVIGMEYDDEATAPNGQNKPAGKCGRDVNAGALHIVLTNRLGFEGQGLIADFSSRKPVNQHPIYGFSSEQIGERTRSKNADPSTVREVRIRTVLKYAHYASATWDAVETREKERTLNYWLELDSEGEIVGGSYVSGKVPDYVWYSEPISFEHGYEVLNALVTQRTLPKANFPKKN